MHETRAHPDDLVCLSTGTPSLSQLALGDGYTKTTGIVDVDYDGKAYFVAVMPVQAILKYRPPRGMRLEDAIIGNAEYALRVLQAKGHNLGKRDAPLTPSTATNKREQHEDKEDDGLDHPSDTILTCTKKTLSTVLERWHHWSADSRWSSLTEGKRCAPYQTVTFEDGSTRTHAYESYEHVANTLAETATQFKNISVDARGNESVRQRGQIDEATQQEMGPPSDAPPKEHGAPVEIVESKEAEREVTPVTPDVPEVQAIRTKQITEELHHLIMGHPGKAAARKTQLRHLHVLYRKDLKKQGGGDRVAEPLGAQLQRPAGVRCESCVIGKGTKTHQRKTPAESPSSKGGGRIFMDTAGPFPLSATQCRWAFIAVDEASGWMTVMPTPNKTSESATICLRRAIHFFANLGIAVASLRTDNGPEFQSHFQKYADNMGIKHELTAYYHPQGNAVAERGWRRLLDKMRAMAHHAGLYKLSKVWDELMHHACALSNITWRAQIDMSPYQFIHPTPADAKHRWTSHPSGEGLMVWGAKCGLSFAPAQIKKDAKTDMGSTTGYYMGRSRINGMTPRFFVPDIRGGIYIETRHYNEIDPLFERRETMPRALNRHLGHTHPRSAQDQPTLVQCLRQDNNSFFEDEGLTSSATKTPSSSTAESDDDEGETCDDHAVQEADPPPPDVDVTLFEGRRFARQFDEGWFEGAVVKIAKVGRGQQVTIAYNDGDLEHLSATQARLLLQLWFAASRRAEPNVPPWDDSTPRTAEDSDAKGGGGTQPPVDQTEGKDSGATVERSPSQGAMRAEQGLSLPSLNMRTLPIEDMMSMMEQGMIEVDDVMGAANPIHYDGLQEKFVQEGIDLMTHIQETDYRWINANGDCKWNDDGAVRLTEPIAITAPDYSTGEDLRHQRCVVRTPDLLEGIMPVDNDILIEEARVTDEINDLDEEFETPGWTAATKGRPQLMPGPDWTNGLANDEEFIEEEFLGEIARVTLTNGKVIYIDPDCPPISYALKGDDKEKWMEACVAELRGQLQMNCWTVVERRSLPRDAKILRTGWRLLRKRKRGIICRWKARAYCCGYAQLPHEHYDPHDIASPTPRAATFRMIVATAVERGLTLHSGDTSLAFLHADIDRKMWIRAFPHGHAILPEVFSGDKNEVAELHKSLWGLRQASMLFYKEFRGHLVDTMGFTQSEGDRCLFFRAKDESGQILVDYDPNENRPGVKVAYLITYVDDVAAATTDQETWDEIVKEVQNRFQFRCEGRLENFLGVEIDHHEDGGVILRHRSKIDRIVDACQVRLENGTVPIKKNPLPDGTQLSKLDDEGELSDEEAAEIAKFDYRMIIGMLLHTYVWVRPDIGAAMQQLTRVVSTPRMRHIRLVQHLAKYLANTRDHGLHYVRGTDRQVDVWVDADYAMCTETRRSVTGYGIIMCGAAVAWMSKRQPFISLSSTEAELGALRDVCAEILALRKDLALIDPQLANIRWRVWEDNQAAIAIMEGGGKYESRKHIAVRALWCRSMVGSVIDIHFVGTAEQVADCLTKCLAAPAHIKHRQVLLNDGVHTHQERRCQVARLQADPEVRR